MPLALRLWCRSEVRRARASFVLIIVAGGLALAVAVSAASASRRAESAWDRLREATAAPDAVANASPESNLGDVADQLRGVPGVAAVATFTYTPVAPAPLRPGVDTGAFVRLDDELRVYRPVVIQGRMPLPGRSDEFTVNESLARLGHYSVGDRVTLRGGFEDPFTDLGTATVVGIHRGTFDVSATASAPFAWLPYGFFVEHGDRMVLGPGAALLRADDGAVDLDAFATRVQEAAPNEVFVVSSSGEEQVVAGGLSSQRIGYLALAAVAALAALAAIGQAITRVTAASDGALTSVSQLGLRPRDRRTLATAPFALAAVPTAMLAIGAGWIGTALLPTGLARNTDPDLGARFDPFISAVAAAVIVVAFVAAAAWGARSAPRRPVGAGLRSSRFRHVILRLAVEPFVAGRPAPVATAARSAVVATVVGLMGVVGAVVFMDSSATMARTPELHGWGFDLAVVSEEAPLETLRSALEGLQTEPSVSALGFGHVVSLLAGEHPVETFAIDPLIGATWPTIVDGRPPIAQDEIVLARDTLEGLDVDVGDTVELGAHSQVAMRVVGEIAYPELGNNGDVANGAALLLGSLDRIDHEVSHNVVTVSGDDDEKLREIVERRLRRSGLEAELVTPFAPPRLRNLRQIGSTPLLLLLFLVALTTVSAAHAATQAVRHRRHDMAVLRALGFRSAQVRSTVRAQAALIAVAGLLLGVPLGLAAGRWTWRLAAASVGVARWADFDPLHLVAAAAACALAVITAAAIPSIGAGRGLPARDLTRE